MAYEGFLSSVTFYPKKKSSRVAYSILFDSSWLFLNIVNNMNLNSYLGTMKIASPSQR